MDVSKSPRKRKLDGNGDEDDEENIDGSRHSRKVRKIKRNNADDGMSGTLLIVEPAYFTFDVEYTGTTTETTAETAGALTASSSITATATAEDEKATYLRSHRAVSLITSTIDPVQFSTIEVKRSNGLQRVDVAESQMEDLISMTHLTSTLSAIIEEFQKAYPLVSSSCISGFTDLPTPAV